MKAYKAWAVEIHCGQDVFAHRHKEHTTAERQYERLLKKVSIEPGFIVTEVRLFHKATCIRKAVTAEQN